VVVTVEAMVMLAAVQVWQRCSGYDKMAARFGSSPSNSEYTYNAHIIMF